MVRKSMRKRSLVTLSMHLGALNNCRRIMTNHSSSRWVFIAPMCRGMHRNAFLIQHPLEKVMLPKVLDNDRDDLPSAALELTDNPTPPAHDWFVSQNQWKPAVQAFLASSSFTDDQVGRLLKALDQSQHADNTIVVLYSDHGFHLGEKQRWAKQSLWERSTRVPFIIYQPGQKTGQRCAQPVELMSIYPTLLELCGLPSKSDLEGVSLSPLLDNPDSEWDHPAITTYQQNNHAVRSRDFRYNSLCGWQRRTLRSSKRS